MAFLKTLESHKNTTYEITVAATVTTRSSTLHSAAMYALSFLAIRYAPASRPLNAVCTLVIARIDNMESAVITVTAMPSTAFTADTRLVYSDTLLSATNTSILFPNLLFNAFSVTFGLLELINIAELSSAEYPANRSAYLSSLMISAAVSLDMNTERSAPVPVFSITFITANSLPKNFAISPSLYPSLLPTIATSLRSFDKSPTQDLNR